MDAELERDLPADAPTPDIRLLLVDDHILFREGLARLLQAEKGLSLVGHFSSAQQALSEVNLATIDVVLLDFDLGERQGIQFLREAPLRGFRGRVLMVTAGMSKSDMQAAVQNGASGIFPKHNAPNSLIDAIRQIAEGKSWPDAGVGTPSTSELTEAQSSTHPASNPSLSRREEDVLKGVFEGLTNKEIGAHLDISESYVKAVLQQLFAKTGVRTRSQLVRVALEKRLA